MDKLCKKCKKEKDVSFFNKDKSNTDNLNAICKVCSREKARKYHSKEYNCVIVKNKKLGRWEKQKYILDYLLVHPCVDCGEKDPIVLQFDHQRDKIKSISALVRSCSSLEKIIEEIAKCEIRCANCHIRRHSKERGYRKEQLLNEMKNEQLSNSNILGW